MIRTKRQKSSIKVDLIHMRMRCRVNRYESCSCNTGIQRTVTLSQIYYINRQKLPPCGEQETAKCIRAMIQPSKLGTPAQSSNNPNLSLSHICSRPHFSRCRFRLWRCFKRIMPSSMWVQVSFALSDFRWYRYVFYARSFHISSLLRRCQCARYYSSAFPSTD